MEKKQLLIKLLEECIMLEEDAIPLYTQHLNAPDFFKNISAADVERVKKALQTLADEARSHKAIFESLLAKVKDGPGHGL